MRGFIIRSPHVDNILEGRKTWEMRSQAVSIRETIALIKAGSGTIVGVVDIVDCLGPLSIDERLSAEDKHCIPARLWWEPQFKKYEYAWVLGNVRPLKAPVRYIHPMGAQGFVRLRPDTVGMILEQLGELRPEGPVTEPAVETFPLEGMRCFSVHVPKGDRLSLMVEDKRLALEAVDVEIIVRWKRHIEPCVLAVDHVTDGCMSAGDAIVHSTSSAAPSPRSAKMGTGVTVPYAADGSYFHPGLRRARTGEFTVGEKDNEVTFDSFEQALAYLRRMPVAKWRRPNESGNWGIVAAVRWDVAN